MKKKFGKKLKALRLEKDELLKDIAEELNKSVSMISTYENGINYPDVETLIKMAEYFNVSTDYLLCLNNNEEKNEKRNIKYYKCKF